MKTKYITLTVALLISLYTYPQAQSDEGNIWDGIAGTLTNMFDEAIQGTEAGRLFMLFNSDIRMTMKAHNDGDIVVFNNAYFGYRSKEFPSEASIYAEFDWDNKALFMHLKKSEKNTLTSFGITGVVFGGGVEIDDAIDHYQFTDKDGFWYVPFEHPSYQGTGEQNYVKINAKRAAQSVLEDLSDPIMENLIDAIRVDLGEIVAAVAVDLLLSGDINSLFEWFGFNPTQNSRVLQTFQDMQLEFLDNIEDMEQFDTVIRELLNERYTAIVGFPVFIHWALLYSPNLIRSKFNVTETTYNCYGIPNGCTKLTIASGRERGKFMIFDRYNRLIYIDSKKEGSVRFEYDRDVTVNLPPAYIFNDVIRDAIESQD